MTVVEIVLLILVGVMVLLFAGGVVAGRRRAIALAPEYAEHLAHADHALEQARAADRGWDRDQMEGVVRAALAEDQPGVEFESVELVLVDDRPGVDQDRAEFEASGGGRTVRVVLGRDESGWRAARVG